MINQDEWVNAETIKMIVLENSVCFFKRLNSEIRIMLIDKDTMAGSLSTSYSSIVEAERDMEVMRVNESNPVASIKAKFGLYSRFRG